MILHFNRGTSDPDGDGHYDCIPAVDNFQLISGDEGLSWGPVTNISSFLQVRDYTLELARNLRKVLTITEKTPTRAFSWLKAPASTFTFKTLLRLEFRIFVSASDC